MKLVGKTIVIVSDNENYEAYQDRKLVITQANNSGYFYDSAMYPENLCDMEDALTGKTVPFALYEYEFKVLN